MVWSVRSPWQDSNLLSRVRSPGSRPRAGVWLVETEGIEPSLPLCGSGVFPFGRRPRAGVTTGIRTRTRRFTASRANRYTMATMKRSRPESNRRCAVCSRAPFLLATRPSAPAAGIEPALFRLTAGRLSAWPRWNEKLVPRAGTRTRRLPRTRVTIRLRPETGQGVMDRCFGCSTAELPRRGFGLPAAWG